MAQLFSLNLRRVTSGRAYVPEVDGFRFLGLSAVIFQHLNTFWIAKVPLPEDSSIFFTPLWHSIITLGDRGMESFFIMSGYLLATPFANQYFGDRKEVSLKKYFKRRLLRLEPPYILVMIILFLFSVYVVHKYTFSTLFPSLLASLTYTHNFFYGREVLPLINMVAWSLEVEVQFYILAPLMAMVFKLKKEQRRIILFVAAFLSIVIQGYHLLPFRSLPDYLHFFLAGFLMADYKVSGKSIQLNSAMNKITGGLSIVALVILNAYWYDDTNFFLNIGLFICLSVLVYMCILQGFMKPLLSAKFTTTIGGMCYSVYLVHAAVLSVVLNMYLRRIVFHAYFPDFLLYSVIAVVLVGIVSSVYYVLVEKPCMQKGWYKIFIPTRLVNKFNI